jgi:hypothetical protein
MVLQRVLVLAMWAFPASAGAIGYAQATGYFKKDSRPTLHQPLNLLDGRDATSWCSTSSDSLNDSLSIGFKGPISLDELRISTGNNFDANTWSDFGRARKFLIRSGKQTRTFSIEDVRGFQSLPIEPPIIGSRFIIEVLDQYPSDNPDSPVCISDVVFVAQGKALNGTWLTPKLKFDKYAAVVMGPWFSGFEGTPDRFLTFHFDGTFRATTEPFDTTRNQEKVTTGNFDASQSQLTFEVAGKKYYARYSKDPAQKQGHVLTFQGNVPPELQGPWRSEP